MIFSELAKELRKRQLEKKIVPIELINALSDVDIVDSYFDCAKCRKNVWAEEAQQNLMQSSHSVDEFVERISLGLKWHTRVAHRAN
jgi:hypothetical protein